MLEKGLMAVIVPESSGSPGIGFLHYLLIKMISHSKKEVVGVTPPRLPRSSWEGIPLIWPQPSKQV